MFFQCCLNYPCGFAGVLWEISIVACSVSAAVPELCREVENSSQIQRVCAEGFLGSLLYFCDNDMENLPRLLVVKSISGIFSATSNESLVIYLNLLKII